MSIVDTWLWLLHVVEQGFVQVEDEGQSFARRHTHIRWTHYLKVLVYVHSKVLADNLLIVWLLDEAVVITETLANLFFSLKKPYLV